MANTNNLSLRVPPSEGVAVRLTDLLYGHLTIGLTTSILVLLVTHSAKGSEAVIHQLLVALTPEVQYFTRALSELCPIVIGLYEAIG